MTSAYRSMRRMRPARKQPVSPAPPRDRPPTVQEDQPPYTLEEQQDAEDGEDPPKKGWDLPLLRPRSREA